MIGRGTILEGKYEIIEEIGSGGGGIVYLAYHHGLQKQIVVKQIKGAFINGINTRLEVDILKKLHHAHLPQVYDFVQVDNQIFTVMDYISGYDLEFYRKEGYVIPEVQLVQWLNQLLNVLDYLHNQPMPIIHSDIKPANIMVNEQGNICLIDFNISIDTQEVVVKGASLNYAAPEQMEALQYRMMGDCTTRVILDERTDIYSLGMTMYVLMTGYTPSNQREAMYRIQDVNRGYSQALVSIVHKMMEEQPSRRYHNARKVMHALELMEKRPSSKLRNWNIGLTLGYVGVMALSIGFITIGVWNSKDSHLQEDYEELQDAYEAYQIEDIKEIGMEILDDKSYQRSLKRSESQEAEVNYMIGEAYYWEANYAKARSYYEDALEASEDNKNDSVYYREIAICLAKEGDYDDARDTLEEAEDQGCSSEDLKLAEAEILLAEGDTQGAKGIFEEIIASSRDSDILYRCNLELAEVYEAELDWEQAITCLESAYEYNENTLVLRKLGVAYSDYSSQLSSSQEKRDWNAKAQAVYEELVSLPDRTYEDCLNCALVYENNGDYLASLEMLNEMYDEYPEDYVVSKRMCYVLYYIELQSDSLDRDYTSIMYYYEIAKQQYDIMNASGYEDTEMINLEQLITSLEGRG